MQFKTKGSNICQPRIVVYLPNTAIIVWAKLSETIKLVSLYSIRSCALVVMVIFRVSSRAFPSDADVAT